MLNLFDVVDKVRLLAEEIGTMQRANLGRTDLEIAKKSSGIDLVTEIDKKSEHAIVEFLQKNYPTHGILAEESGLTQQNSEYLWIVDPLDGTTNYAQGLPIFAISIALQHHGETVLGVVYAPVLGQMFTAVKGDGAYLNGQKLHVAEKTTLIESVLATGFPYDIAEHPHNNVQYFAELVVKARAVRRMGAAAYDLACVAAGKFDGYWELKLSPWDAAAGILLVQEAGGQVIHFRNDRGISIIAGNQDICQLIRSEISIIDEGK